MHRLECHYRSPPTPQEPREPGITFAKKGQAPWRLISENLTPGVDDRAILNSLEHIFCQRACNAPVTYILGWPIGWHKPKGNPFERRLVDYFSAIRAFLHAADTGSFSQAAKLVEVKTSTVSRYIDDLEKDLGIALFNRSTRGLVLTEGGRVFRQHVAVAIKSLDEAREITASLNSAPQGRLRVTMPRSFGRRHVIRHLPEFMDRYPKIEVDAVLTDDNLNMIEAGIDVAIRIGALADSQLIARQLAKHQRIVCASPTYLAQHGMPASPEDLAKHETLCLALVPDDKWLFVNGGKGAPLKERFVQLHSRLRVDDTEAALDLAIAGRVIAFLPTWAVGSALQTGKLVRLLPDWEAQPSRGTPSVWAVYPPKKTVSSKVRVFVDFYAAKFSQKGYWQA